MTMTTKELLALVGKATPGPWSVEFGTDVMAGVEHREPGMRRGKNMVKVAEVDDLDGGTKVAKANAALIVAAVNALPALCAEVEALRKDAERLDWLASKPDAFANIDRITSVGGLFNGLPNLRAAIDAAKEPK